MNDLISRQAAIDAECEACQIAPKKERGHNCTYYVHGCKEIECLRALPSARSERKKGKWIDKWHMLFIEELPMCSVCNKFSNFKSDYCPNCGADMRGEEHE